MKIFHSKYIDILLIIIITIIGIIHQQVTVFYIIYLFWFQELIRTVIDLIFNIKSENNIVITYQKIPLYFSPFFILFIYFVFIVVVFGVMLNWGVQEVIKQNVLILFFKNWYFNTNIILFTLQYFILRKHIPAQPPEASIFNSRHIVLHISIILGALINGFLKRHDDIIDNVWISIFSITPFLILKIFLDSRIQSEQHDPSNQ